MKERINFYCWNKVTDIDDKFNTGIKTNFLDNILYKIYTKIALLTD